MIRAKYGDRDACKVCGQDIEFHGKARGWIDRGSDRLCQLVPDADNLGAWVKPPRKTLHKPWGQA
jgi:hypothetical protein